MDEYQSRYLEHQDKKKRTLMKIIKDRHSTRIFSDLDVSDYTIRVVLEAVGLCPSSCDRKAIDTMVISDRDDKALLGGLLVGGVGWVHRAPKIILLFADGIAYKENIPYMPYLDIGVVIQQIYLVTEALSLKGCYINPNIREKNIKHFREYFDVPESYIFGGAFAIGQDKKD